MRIKVSICPELSVPFIERHGRFVRTRAGSSGERVVGVPLRV